MKRPSDLSWGIEVNFESHKAFFNCWDAVHRYVSVNKEGYPSLWSQVPSQHLVPCPFQGSIPSPVTGPVWSPVLGPVHGGTPVRTGVAPLRTGVPPPPARPSQDWGTPSTTQRGQFTPRVVCQLRFPAWGLFVPIVFVPFHHFFVILRVASHNFLQS